MQSVCSVACAMVMAAWRREKEAKAAAVQERKTTRQALLRLKPRAKWLKETQAAFNAFIRERDKWLPCISCGRHHAGQYHAGHYLSTGARPELRFSEYNCHKQCQPCNMYLSGNLLHYREALISKIGYAEVQRLEGPHEAAKWTIDDLQALKAHYVAKLKELVIGRS